MKITVFNASPGGQTSNTEMITSAFLKGAKEKEAQVETVYLKDYNINHCTGCFECWFKNPGKCIFNDDMAMLMDKYMSSDIVVYGTPLYGWTLTAYLKNFIDRLIPMHSPILQNNSGNFDLEKTNEPPKVITVCNCGFPGDNNFDIVKPYFKIASPILEIYRNCGKALKSNDENVKVKVEIYLNNVREAGKLIAEKKEVTDRIINNINAPLMSIPAYVKLLGM